MKENSITYNKIGVIKTPFEKTDKIPIQSVFGKDIEGRVEIYPEYTQGLIDLENFSHIYLVYHFHHSKSYNLLCKPFLDDKKHGIFAIRGPNRPNSIGISLVELISIEDNIINIRGIDIFNGTPLLDIKPYIEKFDVRTSTRSGWIQDKL